MELNRESRKLDWKKTNKKRKYWKKEIKIDQQNIKREEVIYLGQKISLENKTKEKGHK